MVASLMCGIVGISSPEPVRAGDDAPLARAVAALRHRGPDGQGTWVSPATAGPPAWHVGLGHTRLAITDLAGGGQPMASEDGAVVAVVNGAIYGAEAQRAVLVARGHVFRSRSDSELVVHLYEEHGIEAARHLRGQFAVLLWDARERLLWACRDRFGIKPLVYGRRPDGALVLASETSALFAAGVPRTWDDATFFHAASLQYLPPGATLYAGVRQLRPGHHLLARDRAVEERRWWDLDTPPIGDEIRLGPQVLRADLEDAVRLRTVADVPVACLLSGGLDSSLILALAARIHDEPVPAFTLSFGGAAAGYDESAAAREVAAHVGASLQEVRVGPRALVDALPAAVRAADTLVINGHAAARGLLAAAVRDAGFRVVLTGEGADELFAGYDHVRSGGHDPTTVGVMLPHGPALSTAAARARLGFVPTWLAAKAGLGHRVRSLLRPDFVAAHAHRDPVAELLDLTDVRGQLAGRHPVRQALYLWTRSALANYILRAVGDGQDMASGVEARLPFLDHHLAARALAAPIPDLLRGGVEKHVLRQAAAPLLPAHIANRRKHPFLAPPAIDAARDALAQALRDQLDAGAPAFVDPDAVERSLSELGGRDATARAAWDPALMMILSATLLAR